MLKKFKVTKEILHKSVIDLQNGGRQSQNCAIATTLKEIFPFVSFSGSSVSINGRYAEGVAFTVPKEVQHYAFEFDTATMEERENLPEFEFTLDIPNYLMPKNWLYASIT
jgi:hypothetical protein